MNYYLSYLMGAGNITDEQLAGLGVEIVEKKKLKIPAEKLQEYIDLIKTGLSPGFWNEVVGSEEIIFVFKFKDETIKEFELSIDNEAEIAKLCSEFANESPDKTKNVYKYISENSFYHDFMIEHYSSMINR
ncbi:MAG: hypothetical protein KBC81_03065 [Candidatus Pacebacteria bacterium]|nr:hypothetical protein [Candidatus Paceibacterota bacterium]